MFGVEINIAITSLIGLIGWTIAISLYNKLKQAEADKLKLQDQKEKLREMISSELKSKYEEELTELKRYQTHYLVHMEERDKILSSLASLIKTK
jgi:uncharacterized protein YpmS